MHRRRSLRPSRGLADRLVAAAWGFAEATAFFIVPDVWTSRIALRSPRRGMASTADALAGALAGGLCMYAVGRSVDPERCRELVTKIPGIDRPLVEETEQAVLRSPEVALLLGPPRGVPYKLFALAHGRQRRSLGHFLVVSVPARWVRFALVTGGVGAAGAAGRSHLPPALQPCLPAVFYGGWVAFYTWYFRRGPGARLTPARRPSAS